MRQSEVVTVNDGGAVLTVRSSSSSGYLFSFALKSRGIWGSGLAHCLERSLGVRWWRKPFGSSHWQLLRSSVVAAVNHLLLVLSHGKSRENNQRKGNKTSLRALGAQSAQIAR